MDSQTHLPAGLGQAKNCQNCKQEFVIESDDFAFYGKIKVPPPTFCPDCRLQRRLIFRNEHFLYKVKSDFSELFFFQLNKLLRTVPIFALSVIRGVNSPYSNNFDGFRNCYLCFNGNYCEDCMYGVTLSNSKNSLDLSACSKCENCYESFWLESCTNCFYCNQCSDSFNLWFCKNCVGCNDCFGSVNLRNKKYCIFNQQYTRDQYIVKIKEFNMDSYASVLQVMNEINAFWLRHPVKFLQGLKNMNVSGNYVYNSKNAKNSFLIREAENVRYCSYMEIGPLRDCYDYTVWGNGAELLYEALNTGLGAHNVRFSAECWPEVRNIEYSLFCQSSSNLFGCVGLRNKQYCILNKQYTKEEYEALVPKIIEHMNEMPYVDPKGNSYCYGEFFPPMMSLYAYNHSPAQEHFPMIKIQAEAIQCFWIDSEDRGYQITKKSSELPDSINDVDDIITKEIILCEEWGKNEEKAKLNNCTKAFRILSNELEFYRRYNIPLPRKCFYCRHNNRIKNRNPFKLWNRQCTKCGKEFETSYAPDRPEIVYCETCYNQEVA